MSRKLIIQLHKIHEIETNFFEPKTLKFYLILYMYGPKLISIRIHSRFLNWLHRYATCQTTPSKQQNGLWKSLDSSCDGWQWNQSKKNVRAIQWTPQPNLFCSPYLYNSNSVNSHIPDCEAKVKYQSFNQVVTLGLKHGISAFATKADFLSAFRNFPVLVDHLIFLGFTLDNKYFINSSMAFGSCSSCKISEEFACTVQWIHENETHLQNISHYLDDFIVVDKSQKRSKKLLKKLQKISKEIGAPLSPKKTEEPTQEIIYLGMLLNFKNQVISIPADKIEKALSLIENAIFMS